MTAQMDWSKWKTAAAVLMLCALCFLAFGGALRCGFVHYDDDLYVFGNPQVLNGLSWPGARWAFTTGHAGNWHPLTWLSLMADTEWCGGAARGYHATSVFLHALNGVLLFFAWRRWTGRFGLPLAAAALWAVHPLRTESVVWISERKDVLATFFGLLALGAYGRKASERGTRPARAVPGGHASECKTKAIVLVALFFALSLLAKPTWVTLPFVLLLVDVWPLGRWRKESAGKLVGEKAPLFLLSGLSCAATLIVQQAGGAMRTFEGYPLDLRVANAAVATVHYLRAWVWPVDLAVFYPYPDAGHSAAAVGGSLAVIFLLTAGAVRMARRQPWAGVGWLWFLGTLVPMIGLVQVGGQAWADRYSYLPHVGLTVALTWGAGEVSRVNVPGYVKTKACVGLLMMGLVLSLALLSRRQTAVWQNSETLFVRALQVTERNAMAHGALGFAYAAEGRNAEAVDQLKRTLEIQPDNLRALNNLSWIWATDPKAEPGQVEAAANLARRAMEQVRRAKAEGGALEAGVETAVMDTLEKAESRRISTAP